jgi:hypothetical protein
MQRQSFTDFIFTDFIFVTSTSGSGKAASPVRALDMPGSALTRHDPVMPKTFSRFLCFLASVILSIRAIAGSAAASYEVGFDYNYRSYDAIFPRMRESFLENDTNVTSFIEKLQPCWHGKELAAKTARRFRAEYPEDNVSDDELARVLRRIQIRHMSGTRILTVTVESENRHLSECLAGTFARSLVRHTDEVVEREVAHDLAPLRARLKQKEKELEDLKNAAEKVRSEGKDQGLVQPSEYVRLSRLRSEKAFPEYDKMFLEEERQTRARELDKIVAFVLGPARTSDQVVPNVRGRCLEAERLAVKEAEWQRKEWNDRWSDRLEQVRLRAESPRRKYLSPCSRSYGLDEYCTQRLAVDTNSALYGFLGCPFGEKSKDSEHYVRLAEPFEGFPWVRYDTCRSCQKIARCDARLTFRTLGLSEVPFRRILRVRDVFQDRYGLVFAEERRGEDYFAEAYTSPGYRVGLFVTNALVQVGDAVRIEYTLGFEVVNEQVLSQRVRRMQDGFCCNWHDVLHVTDIPQTMRNDDAAWTYRVVRGRSTEELLDEWIRTGNRAILNQGKKELGVPVSWSGGGSVSGYFSQHVGGRNTGYCCTEWEADQFLTMVGSFVKICDLETQQRISSKLYHPGMFRRREKGKTGNYFVGRIYCDLIPGDRVTWDTADWRKTGTVCEDGEPGEYWDCIKKNMKNVESIEKATEEDWHPTALAEKFSRRRTEVNRKSHQIRGTMWWYDVGQLDAALAADTNIIAAVNFLDECLDERQPGVYVPPHMEHILDLSYPSREFARRKVRHWENMRRAELQADLCNARREILDRIFSNMTFSNGLPATVVRRFKLSRYECERYGASRELRKLLDSRCSFDLMVIPVHHPRDEPPRVFTTDEIGRAKRVLSPLANRLVDFSTEESDGRRKTDGGDVVLLIYDILYSALSSQKGHEAVADLLPRCSTVVGANLHQAPMLWIVRRVTVEFKDNPASWKFAEDVKAELERLEQVSFVSGRAKAKERLEEWLKSDWAKTWRKGPSTNCTN